MKGDSRAAYLSRFFTMVCRDQIFLDSPLAILLLNTDSGI
jgi:hypothetical protein